MGIDPFAALGVQAPSASQAAPVMPTKKGGIDPFMALGIDPGGNYTPTPQAPTQGRGIAQNFAAGANRSIFGALGAPVDVATAAINLIPRGINAATGANVPTIQEPVGGAGWLSRKWGRLTGTNPQDVQPQTEGERMAAAGGGAVAQVPLMSLGGAGAVRAGLSGLPGDVAQAVAGSGGATARQAALTAAAAGAGGATGQATEDAAPDSLKPYANLAGNLAGAAGVAGLAAGAGAGADLVARKAGEMGIGSKQTVGGVRATPAQINAAGQKVAGALGPEGQQIIERAAQAEGDAADLEQAGQQVPREIQARRINLVPGAEPTTAQLAPTPGAVALEKAHRVATPEPFQQRAQDQNRALVGAIQGAQPTGSPGAVGQFFRQQLDALDQAGQQTTAQAQTDVARRTSGLGAAVSPAASGEAIRGDLAARNAAAKARETKLWAAIDPDGTLAMPLGDVQATAQGLLQAIKPGLGDVLNSQEQQILQGAAGLPSVVPFSAVQRLRSNIGAAERALRAQPGNDQSLRRLGMVKSALDDAIANAAETAAHGDEGVAARLAALRAGGEFGSGSGLVGGAQTLGHPNPGVRGPVPGAVQGPGEAAPVPERAGSPNEGGRGAGLGGGDSAVEAAPAVAGLAPNFTTENAAQYAAAREATRNRKQTFGTGPVGATLRSGAQGAEHRLADAEVPRQFLTGNAVEPTRVQAYIDAVGGEPQAVQHMRDALVGDLHEKGIIQADGTVKPDAFATWLQRRSRTIDLFPGLRGQFDSVAKAQQALDDTIAGHAKALRDFQSGVASNFLKDDPFVAVRKAFSSGNPTETFTQLVRATQSNPDAQAGLRRGIVDFILERLSSTAPAGTDDIDFLKADTFRRWIKQNRGPLKAVFGGQGAQNLEMVGAFLRRQAQRTTATAGSDTVQKAIAAHKSGVGQVVAHGLPLTVMTLVGERLGEMLGGHSVVGAVALPALGTLAHAMKQAGIETTNDLVREAMLHPELARTLMQHVSGNEILPVTERRIGAAIRAALLADMTGSSQRKGAQ